MFKEFVETKHYSFHEGFADWRDAIRAACAPLLADGTIERNIQKSLSRKSKSLGPTSLSLRISASRMQSAGAA